MKRAVILGTVLAVGTLSIGVSAIPARRSSA